MLIDSTRVMYAAFMEARWAKPATGSSLIVVLDDVLDVVIQQQALVVTVPDVWMTGLDDTARYFGTLERVVSGHATRIEQEVRLGSRECTAHARRAPRMTRWPASAWTCTAGTRRRTVEGEKRVIRTRDDATSAAD